MTTAKIACLGGGSLYFPRAIGDLLVHKDLAGAEIVLYDLDAEKAEAMATMGRRLAKQSGTGCAVRATAALGDAVDGARFVISSIGGSGAEVVPNVYGSYYHSADMHIPARYGIQQVVGDTAGPAGMMMGLRAVPAHLGICREMEKRCPNAMLLSHSNPMGILCRTMNKYSDVNVAGICHGVQATIGHAAQALNVPADELECLWIGTNHYYWILRAVHRGIDLTETLRGAMAQRGGRGGKLLADRLSALYGYGIGYPGTGHLVEFYSWATRMPRQEDLPYNLAEEAKAHGFDASQPMPSREPQTAATREAFFENFRKILDGVTLPDPGTVDYVSEEGIARLISAVCHGRREVFIVNIPNRGAVPNLSADAVIEMEAVTDSAGVRGVTVGDCPAVLKGILEKRFAWQDLVAEAAVTGDRALALQALMLDEMAIHPDAAESMLDELLEASRDLLPQFFT